MRAERRLAAIGPNALAQDSRSPRAIVLEQVRGGINLLLALARSPSSPATSSTGRIILGLIALNVGLSIVQEFRAERAE